MGTHPWGRPEGTDFHGLNLTAEVAESAEFFDTWRKPSLTGD
jgi:hypothetical protein